MTSPLHIPLSVSPFYAFSIDRFSDFSPLNLGDDTRPSQKRRPLFVTETLPGSLVRRALPIYGDFFEAHKINLQFLRLNTSSGSSSSSSSSSARVLHSTRKSISSGANMVDETTREGGESDAHADRGGLHWTMICPGFLHEGCPSPQL